MKKTTLLKCLFVIFAFCFVFSKQASMENVYAAPVQINTSRIILDKGDYYQLKLLNFNYKKFKATWTSSNPSVVYVNQNGKIACKARGNSLITASVKTSAGTKTYKCLVYVETPSISRTSIKMYSDTTYNLKMNGTYRTVKWASNNTSVVQVTQSGYVKAVKGGTACIITRVGNKYYRCYVTVIQRQVISGPAADVLKLTNAQRKARGLSELTTNAYLQAAANKRAYEISQYFDHTRPDGRSCFTVFEEYNINYRSAGENIAAGYKTATAVVNGWMDSPGHRSNMLRDGYGKMGVGYYYNGNTMYRTHWVQLFTD